MRSLGPRMTPLVTTGPKDLPGGCGQTVSKASDLMASFKPCEDGSGLCFRWPANKEDMSRVSMPSPSRQLRDSG